MCKPITKRIASLGSMEDSITSSSVSYSYYDSLESSASSEESGWTAYLEDLFLAPHPQRKQGGFSSAGSSIISDASWKPMLLGSKSRRKLLSEKNKEIRSFNDDDDDDDPLEDTASSTTASLDNLKASTETSKKDELANAAQEGVDCGGERKSSIANVIGFIEGSNGWTDLRERGVCLIPFSQLLIDYLDESSHC